MTRIPGAEMLRNKHKKLHKTISRKLSNTHMMKKVVDKKLIMLQAGEKLSPEFLSTLKKINASKKVSTFVAYRSALTQLLHSGNRALKEKHRHFLGGFILGEGSINVSLKRDRGTALGLSLDPQFSLTQHINQSSHLMACLDLFQTGRIYHKSGSNATLVYVMDSRRSLEEKLLPFWEQYISPYQLGEEKGRLIIFKKTLEAFQRKEHLSKESFVEKVLPLWDSLRKQRAQSNESFPDLKSAQDFVRAACSPCPKRS